MPKAIEDEFTNLPITRQRRWQLRNQVKGLCVLCSKPVHLDTVLCRLHYDDQRRRNKEYNKSHPEETDKAVRMGRTGEAFDLRPGAEYV